MAIKVRCPGCRQKIRYDKAPDNRVGRCPRCSAVVLSMEDDHDSDASIGPDASHDAVVPGPRRRSRPEEETAVFTPLFAAPVPAVAVLPPLPVPAAHPPAIAAPPPARRRFLRVHKIGGASFSRRGSIAPVYAASPAAVIGDIASALGISIVLGLSLVGALVLAFCAIVVMTQFP
jgi:hypothetical protein